MDEENVRTLRDVPDAVHYRFHPLLSLAKLQEGEIDIAGVLGKAQRQLDRFDGEIGAIVWYWDFPSARSCPS